MRRAELLRVNLVDLLCLGLAFITSLVVPKLAIDALGADGYGVVAVLLGVSLIPSFLEFGLTPGLTREIGRLQAAGSGGSIRRVILQFQARMGAAGLVVTVLVAVLAVQMGVAGATGQSIFIATAAGGLANVLVLVSDIGLIRVRVAGEFVRASVVRALYSVVYLSGVILFSTSGGLAIESIFVAQLGGALGFLVMAQWLQRRLEVVGNMAGEADFHLSKLGWSVAAEQAGRVQSSLLPSLERHYMHSSGGATAVAAYDVALRLAALVTAAPAAIASPLVALFSPNVAKHAHEKNRHVLRYVDLVTGSLVIAVGAAVYIGTQMFAIGFYGLEGSPLIAFSGLILVGSGINALTASRVALLYAHDKPGAILVKSLADLGFAAVGITMMVMNGDPMLFAASKYLGFAVTAVGLLIFCRGWLLRVEEKARSVA